MNDTYRIITDQTAGLPDDFKSNEQFDRLSMPFLLDDKEYLIENKLDSKWFYEQLANGSKLKTSAVRLVEFENFCRKALDAGKDVIHLSFSSALSSSYNLTNNISKELVKEYKDRKITVIDSKSATGAQGSILYSMLKMQQEGASYEDVVNTVNNDLIPYAMHQFVVNDLHYLASGGRLSKRNAILGSALKIKPILTVSQKGYIVILNKLVGLKKARKFMVESLKKNIDYEKTNYIDIRHSNNLEMATILANEIKKVVKGKLPIKIGYFDYLCGGHCGAGAFGVFYYTKDPIRKEDLNIED